MRAAAWLVLLCACSGGDDTDSGSDSDVDLPNCDGSGFTTEALLWDLPFTLRQGGQDFSTDTQTEYQLLDFTNDGRPDFVLTTEFRTNDNDPLVGSNHWLVFENTGDGFSSDPIEWTLPYDLTRVRDANRLNTDNHAILDIDGDGTLEFVVHRDIERRESDPLVGTAYWSVYANTGSGFSRDSNNWTLPFSLQNGGDNSEPSNSSHTVIGLADGTPGLLVFRDDERASGQRDPLVGSNHWLFFPGTGSGFSTTPVEWRLPFALEGSDNVLSNDDHALVDLRGEGVADFVVIDDVERPSGQQDPLVGSNHWLVFENTGTGFARDEVTWELPYDLDGVSTSTNALTNRDHAVLDLTGDATPDFVQLNTRALTDDDPLVGRQYWNVHVNTSAGFERETQQMSIPYSLLDSPRGDSELSSPNHRLVDLTGDGLPDWLEFRDGARSESDALVGRNHWRVYPAECQ